MTTKSTELAESCRDSELKFSNFSLACRKHRGTEGHEIEYKGGLAECTATSP